jgi:hypothetical protein
MSALTAVAVFDLLLPLPANLALVKSGKKPAMDHRKFVGPQCIPDQAGDSTFRFVGAMQHSQMVIGQVAYRMKKAGRCESIHAP